MQRFQLHGMVCLSSVGLVMYLFGTDICWGRLLLHPSCSYVVLLQVVTRVAADAAAPSGAAGGAGGGGGGLLAPALGEGWGQAASCRVALFWEGPQRYAMVIKAKHVPVEQPAAGQQQQQAAAASSMCVPYYVGPGGIM